jgi:hypothetical protein
MRGRIASGWWSEALELRLASPSFFLARSVPHVLNE